MAHWAWQDSTNRRNRLVRWNRNHTKVPVNHKTNIKMTISRYDHELEREESIRRRVAKRRGIEEDEIIEKEVKEICEAIHNRKSMKSGKNERWR